MALAKTNKQNADIPPSQCWRYQFESLATFCFPCGCPCCCWPKKSPPKNWNWADAVERRMIRLKRAVNLLEATILLERDRRRIKSEACEM